MGILDKFEKGVERALSNTFARAFKADLKPVDITSALRVEMDDRITSLPRGRTVVPNIFVVELGPEDFARIEEWGRAELIEELTTAATSHAADQGYVFIGEVRIDVEEAPDAKPGGFRIRSSSDQSAAPERRMVGAYQAPVAEHPAPQAAAQPPGLHSQPILDVDGQRYLLTGTVTVIGRGTEADIIVNDSGVSRQHVEVRITPEGVVATDLRSTNGTFVEGHRIEAATLVDGNTVSIGRTRIIFWSSNTGTSQGGPA